MAQQPAELLLTQQGTDTATVPDGYVQVTNPINPAQRIANRMAHFTDGVFDTSPTSHLSRLVKVLLGEAGVGQLHKRALLIRLQSSVGGTHFYDLDAFYGGIFGVHRRSDEILPVDPFSQAVTDADWDTVRVRDGAYRARVERFAKALNLGATRIGIEAMCEALLGVDCDVIEERMPQTDYLRKTWLDQQAGTWGALEGQTWGDMERTLVVATHGNFPKYLVKVYPRRILSWEETIELQRMIDRIKPAGCVVEVQPAVDSLFNQLPVSGVYSDSELWEVRSLIRNSAINGTLPFTGADGAFISPPRDAWSHYQGEAWSQLISGPQVVAYYCPLMCDFTVRFDPTAVDMIPQKVVLDSGQEVVFQPIYAIQSTDSILAGRAVSDGILTINPYSGARNNLEADGASAVSNIKIDHLDATVAAGAVLRQTTNRPTFWTTPPRAFNSPATEHLEFRFSEDTVINNITFSYAQFPCIIQFQAWNPGTSHWDVLYSQSTLTAVPFGITGRIPDRAIHPFHFGEGHWVRINTAITPITVRACRFTMVRTEGAGPRGFNNEMVPYPLGLSDIDLGYRLIDTVHVPNINPSQAIATTASPAGLDIQHYVANYRASETINTSETSWRCQPQPVSDCVVSMYVDTRVKTGSHAVGGAQVIDSILINPTQSGPTYNVYWTNAIPNGTSLASAASRDIPIVANVVGSVNSILTGDRGLAFPPTDAATIDIPNTIQFDPRGKWWTVIEFYLVAAPTTASSFKIFSTGEGLHGSDNTSIYWDTAFTIKAYIGTTLASITLTQDITINDKMAVFVQFDPATNGVVMGIRYPDGSIQTTGVTQSASGGSAVWIPATLTFGSTTTAVPIRLTQFALGYGNKTTPNEVLLSASTPSYCLNPPYGTAMTRGTILRYHPSYRGWDTSDGHIIGFVGGALDYWDAVPWQPLMHNVTLRKGIIEIPPVAATALKLEFTNLVAEPYDALLGTTQTAKRMVGATLRGETSMSLTSLEVEDMRLTGVERTSDAAFRSLTNQYRNGVSPATALVAQDPIGRDALRAGAGHGFGVMPWQPDTRMMINGSNGVHTYQVSSLQNVAKVGFFVGIRHIEVGRLNQSLPSDTRVYYDAMLDMANIASLTLNFTSGHLFTPEASAENLLGTALTATSRKFLSRTPVSNVQVAMVQSNPTQLMPDPNFADPSLPTSTFTDVAQWHTSGDAFAFYDPSHSAVLVTRDPAVFTSSYGGRVADSEIVHPIVVPVDSSFPTSTTTVLSATKGGLISRTVLPSPRGMLNIGTRVTAIGTLSNPLFIRVIGSDGTTVLHSDSFTPRAGVQTEMTSQYLLGTNPGLESSIQIVVEQAGAARDSWLMHSLACYDDSILWEFSNDSGTTWMPALGIRNNFNGALQFPKPSASLMWRVTCYRNNAVIDSLQMRPWYDKRLGAE